MIPFKMTDCVDFLIFACFVLYDIFVFDCVLKLLLLVSFFMYVVK